MAAGLVALKRALHSGSPSTESPTWTVIWVPKPPSFTSTRVKPMIKRLLRGVEDDPLKIDY